MQRCPACAEQNPDRARFCLACGVPVADGDISAGRRTVTILFCDVSGFSRLGEQLDLEALREVMSRYYATAKEVIARHGGTVEKYIGDAVVAVFGIPRLHEDDALRAARAAMDIRAAVAGVSEELWRSYGVRLPVHIGVNTGEVIVGQAPARGSGGVTGDAMIVADRLQKAAGPDEIVLAETTRRLLQDRAEVDPLPPLQVAGKTLALRAHRLLRLHPGEPRSATLSAPIVGRDREQRRLADALEQVCEDRICCLFTVLGAAGVGKTRLVEEVAAAAASRATVLAGRCLSYGEGITYWPLMEIVRQATGLTGDEPATQGRQRLADLLAGLPNADAVLDGLAPLVGLGGEEAAVEECFWAVRTFLEELARRAPLVVIFDDIHWAEQTLLDLIEHVADWSRDAPVLLLCVARPELLEMRPTWGGGKLSATSTLLTPLAPGHCAELIRTLIGTDEIDVELQSRITESAAGNPLFVEQMLAALIDDGHLRHDGGAWRAIGDLAAVTVPPTISSLLAARLDRLARPERQVIERAAVVGQLFYLDAVAELSAPTDRSAVPLHCLALVRKELVHSERSDLPGVEAFRFLHVLLRDCAYQATSKQHRAELHEQFALWLENRLAGRAGEHDELAGYHLEQAYHYRGELRHRDEPATAEVGRRAAAHLIAAAERIQQGDRPAAATLLARATRLVPQGSPLWLRARIDIGQVLLGTGRLDEASALLRETVARAQAVGEDRLRAHARLLHLRVRLSVEADELVGETLTEAAAALQIFERTGDTLGAGQAHRAQAAAHTANGQFGPAEEAMRLAVAHAERTGDRRETRQMQRELASLLTWAPRPVRESVPLAERALARAQGTADRALQRELSAQLAVLHTMAGDDAAADAALAEAERIVREIPGSGRDPMFAGMISARIALLRGQDEHAEQALRHSCRGLARIGARAYLATRAAALADLLARAGRYEEAGTFVATARRAAGADHLPTQADWRAAQARILAGEGQLAQALRLAEEARNLRMRTDDPDGQATVLLALADVLRRAGRDEEADTQFALAVGRCERKGNLAGAEQARAMAKAKALPDGALSA